MSEPSTGPDRCQQCGSTVLTRLPMVLTDGTDVLFVSCQACEGRQWLTEHDGEWAVLPIDTVLQRATRKNP